MKPKEFIFLTLLVLPSWGFADGDNFSRGEELFLQDKPTESLAYLQAAAASPDAPPQTFLYLGIVYTQLGRASEAVSVYRKILPSAGQYTALVAFNLGNLYYARNDLETAEDYYNQSIDADTSFASAYLNRANTRLRKGETTFAIADYWQYLSLKGDSEKRPQIEQVLKVLQKEEDERNVKAAAETRRRADIEAMNAANEEMEKQRAMETLPAVQAAMRIMDDMTALIKGADQ
ncbi:MAG: tetratricopeptide repeat protein [Treponema sp.]|jgi:tetratricopeptide (TPR) repeat protein|nr:tetratricopeptide repeat protein [Treponema sp.]